jgi:large subunit ribosomal protein L25
LIDLKIENSANQKVLVKEVTYNPVTGDLQHITFYKPNLKEKITANIPLEFINKELNPLIKGNEAVLITLFDEVEIQALPADLPHVFEIDVSVISEIGEGITVDQIAFDKNKVEIINPEAGELIAKLDYAVQIQTEEEISEEEAIANLEATKEKSKEEKTEE